MSLRSWLATYLPTPADHPDNTASAVAALRHSLHKWTGLRPEVLKSYGIVKQSRTVIRDSDGFIFSVTGSSCSLCQFSRNRDILLFPIECSRCPIASPRDEELFTCDSDDSPYEHWLCTGDPEPMIQLLSETLEKELTKG